MLFYNNSKKKRVSKVLSVLIISIMLVSILPVNALATTDITPPGFTATTLSTDYQHTTVEITVHPDEPLKTPPQVTINGDFPATLSQSYPDADNGNGIYIYTFEMFNYPLMDGKADIMVSGTDLADNYNVIPVKAGSFNIDTVVPSAPTNLHIVGETINYNNQNQLVIEGNAEANSTVNLSITDNNGHDNSLLPPWEAITNADGFFSLVISNIAEVGLDESDNITLSATASDRAGNNSGPATQTILKDTVKPTAPVNLNISNLVNGKIINTNQEELHIIGTATNDSTIEVSLEDGHGHIVIGTQPNVSENQDFDIPVDVSTLDNNPAIKVTAKSIDVAGNVSDLNPTRTVVKNATPPNFTINLNPNPAKEGLVKVSAVSNELLAAAPEISIDGLSNGVMTRGQLVNSYEYTYNIPAFTNGEYSVIITGQDLDGNIGTGSATLVIDTNAPVISEVTGNTLTINSNSLINFNLSEDADVKLEISDGIKIIRTLNPGQMMGGLNSVEWDGILDDGTTLAKDGKYDLRIIAADAVGNVGMDTSFKVQVDRTAPEITGVQVTGKSIASDATINFILNEDARVSVEILNGLLPIRTINLGTVSSGGNSLNWDGKLDNGSTFATDGDYNIKITAEDQMGYVAVYNKETVRIDRTAPNVSNVSLTNKTNSADSNIKFSLSENTVNVIISIFDGSNNLVRTINSGAKSLGENTILWDGKNNSGNLVADGTYSIKIKALDTVGNTFEVSSGSIYVDTTAPAIFNVNILPDNFNPGVVTNAAINFTLGENANVTVQILNNSNTIVKTLNPGAVTKGTSSIQWDVKDDNGNLVPEGNYTVKIIGTDTFGNLRTDSSGKIILDGNAPNISGVNASNKIFATDSIINFSLSEDADVTVQILDGLNPIRTISPGAKTQGGNSVQWDGRLDDGSTIATDGNYNIKITAVDAAGNIGINNSASVVKLTTVPIAPSGLTIAGGYINKANVNNVHITGTALTGNTITLTLNDGRGHLLKGSQTITDGTVDIAFDTGILSDGNINMTITAEDSVGNVSTAVSKTIIKDTLSPIISSVKLGASVFSPVLKKNSISFKLSEGAKVTVKIYDKYNSFLSTLMDNAPKAAGDNSLFWSGKTMFGIVLPNGIYKYEITAIDDAGNSSYKAAGQITIDNSKPILTYVSSKNSSKSRSLKIKWNQNETAATTIKVYDSKSRLVKVLYSATKNKGSYYVYWYYKKTKQFKKGSYFYKITSVDKAGNQGKYTSKLIKLK